MPKTVILQDTTVADLLQALNAVPAVNPATDPNRPPYVPGGSILVPWKTTIGLPSMDVPKGGILSFAFSAPVGYTSRGAYCNFSIAPTGGADYFFRDVCLSDVPGDFSQKLGASAIQHNNEAAVLYFTVGGYPVKKTPYGAAYENKSQPDLQAGKMYFVNIRNQDPSIITRVNYGLVVI